MKQQLFAAFAPLALASLAQAQVTLSELGVDLPSTDNGQEFVELAGVPGTSLAGYFLLLVEGDGTGAGTLDAAYNLGSYALGANGVLLIRDSATVLQPAPAQQSQVVVFDFNPDMENGSTSFLLGFGTPPAVGTDLDSDNDGVLNAGALATFTVVDAVALVENDGASNVGYADDVGGTNLGPFANFNADTAYRTYNADGSACRWAAGDVLGTSPGPYTFDFGANEVFGFAAHGITSGVTLNPGTPNVVFDSDLDGLANACDNCPASANPLQVDGDADGFGDACDNCLSAANASQSDCDADGVGDACELLAGALDTDGNGVPDACQTGLVLSYCTAGTSVAGCTPNLLASGSPSASAASGFTLACTALDGDRTALAFYGNSGPKSSVWAVGSSSYLCVKSPTRRMTATGTGGTIGACDGSYSIDWLDFMATRPSALGNPLTAGQVFHAQVWFRDPSAPGSTNLSNGAQWTMAP